MKLTLRTFFLNLFIKENCLILDLTWSPRDTFLPWSLFCIQEWSSHRRKQLIISRNFSSCQWNLYLSGIYLLNYEGAPYIPRTSWTVILVNGFGSSICFTRYFASSETLGQGSLVKSTLPRIIACAMASSVSVLEKHTNFMKKERLHEFFSTRARTHTYIYTRENIKRD